MPESPEIIAAVVLPLALIVYFVNISPKSREKKSALLLKFRQVRERSLNLQNAVIKYIMQHDSADKNLEEGLTYGQFLKQLKKNHITNLSEKKYIRLKSSDNIMGPGKIRRLITQQEALLDETEQQFEASKK